MCNKGSRRQEEEEEEEGVGEGRTKHWGTEIISPPCPQHGPLFPIPNRSPLPLAYATLPQVLYIDKQTGGVHARRRIEHRTRLGPYEAPLVTLGELVPDKLRLKVFLSLPSHVCPKQRCEWLDLSDENRSNWLMLHGMHIFVCTTRLVLPREELRVIIAEHFFLTMLADTAYTWPCYECPRRLPNWQELQKHLEGHDDVDRSRGRGRSRGRRKFRPGRRVGRPPKVLHTPLPCAVMLMLSRLLSNCFPVYRTLTFMMMYLRRQPGSSPVRLFPCSSCDKTFCRPDKLKLHQLRHSDRRDFLCSVCGKQFKVSAFLLGESARVEGAGFPVWLKPRPERANPWKPRPIKADSDVSFTKALPVNHLTKRHPDVPLHTVPELMLPILRPDRLYFCQHCPKVYKSTSKRKSHILKNHPGCALPASIRSLRPAEPGQPDPLLATHTALAGTVPALPVQCPACSRQYSSKAKMVQHLRKKHTGEGSIREIPLLLFFFQPADLLTQAMSELSKSLPGDIRLTGLSDCQRVAYIPVSAASSVHLQLVQLQQVGKYSPQLAMAASWVQSLKPGLQALSPDTSSNDTNPTKGHVLTQSASQVYNRAAGYDTLCVTLLSDNRFYPIMHLEGANCENSTTVQQEWSPCRSNKQFIGCH
uniref:C2H2-type domain-containing protein n=1 Tax=Eptatretus burgeri TaxID=7764 RepID=A0A8C4QQY3_EPTBU